MTDAFRKLIEKWRERDEESQNGTAWHEALEYCADELEATLASESTPEQEARERLTEDEIDALRDCVRFAWHHNRIDKYEKKDLFAALDRAEGK